MSGRHTKVKSDSLADDNRLAFAASPRKDHRGVDLISDALPFGGLWYTKTDDAVDYAKFFSRAHPALIRVYDDAGNVIATHEHTVKVSNLALSGLPVSMCRQPKSGVQPKADNTQTGPVEIR